MKPTFDQLIEKLTDLEKQEIMDAVKTRLADRLSDAGLLYGNNPVVHVFIPNEIFIEKSKDGVSVSYDLLEVGYNMRDFKTPNAFSLLCELLKILSESKDRTNAPTIAALLNKLDKELRDE